jgi:hypothetical protein
MKKWRWLGRWISKLARWPRWCDNSELRLYYQFKIQEFKKIIGDKLIKIIENKKYCEKRCL